jgi:hypothetical protein
MKIFYYLYIIKLRKLVSKDDHLAMMFIVVGYLIQFLIYYNSFEKYRFLAILFISPVLSDYFNRNDVDLLKLNKNYKWLLFIEKCIMLLPLLIVFLIKKDFIQFVGVFFIVAILINLPKIKSKMILYPFNLFNPFWHICFRKQKLIISLPIAIGLIFIANNYKNDGITLFVFILLGLIISSPTMEKETKEVIKLSPFNSSNYLIEQLKNTVYNSALFIIPVFVSLCLLSKWSLLLFLPLTIVVSIIGTVLKYAFFDRLTIQKLTFGMLIIYSLKYYGAPLLLMPYYYKKAIQNLNTIKYAHH